MKWVTGGGLLFFFDRYVVLYYLLVKTYSNRLIICKELLTIDMFHLSENHCYN